MGNIGRAYSTNAYHLINDISLTTKEVSSKSRWSDDVWILDNPTYGRRLKDSTIRWDIELPDSSRLTDPQWAKLLDCLRRFIWSLMVDPRGGTHLKPGSIGTAVRTGLYTLVRWMVANDYERIDQLDNAASWEFFEFVVEEVSGEDDDEEVSESAIWIPLNALALLYRQSEMFEDAGISPIPEAPFDGRSAFDVTHEAKVKARGSTPPFPDEVAVPVMSASVRMIGIPAEDVIRLKKIYLEAYAKGRPGHYNGPGTSTWSRMLAARLAIEAFEFSSLDDETASWREPIKPMLRHTPNGAISKLDSTQVLRKLITDITTACIVCVQSTTGVRVSELAALRAGLNPRTGLPDCVGVRKSRTGLNEIFYLRSIVSKIHDGTPMEWVLGLRPAGSDYVPPPVQALAVLDELWRPWRENAKTDALLVQFRHGKGIPKQSSLVGPIHSETINRWMKRFVQEYGNLSTLPDVLKTANGPIDIRGYKSGKMVKTRQWRRTYALYVLKTDPSLLPALSQHFKHLSLAMTEEGYIGNDPELLDDIDSLRVQQSARLFYEASTGRKAMAGRMAELINEHIAELRKLTIGKSQWIAYKAVQSWVLENDLRIWFSDHGKCFIGLDPMGSRCHELAGTVTGLNQAPNYTTREPSVCAGCNCFLVDGDHSEFWQRRYASNRALVAEARRIGRLHEYRVAEARMRQAASILRVLHIQPPSQ